MNEAKRPKYKDLSGDATKAIAISPRALLQLFGCALLEPRRLALAMSLLLVGLRAGAATLDRAFDEELNARPFVTQTIATIERDCASVRGPSAEEEAACAWPTSVAGALAEIKSLNGSGPFARTERFAGSHRDLVDRLNAGDGRESEELARLLNFLERGRELNAQAASLLRVLQFPTWKLARALEGESSAGVAQDVRDLTAWLSSETPLGFLRRSAALDPNAAPAFENAVACLTPPDVRAALTSPAGVLVRERLLFQEIDAKRAAWGDVVPGMVSSAGLPEDPLRALRDLERRTENLDLSGLGSELDKCRALSRVQQALGVESATIRSTRLECDQAQREERPLAARPDARLAFGQKALLLLESRRATAGADSVRRQRSAAVYRDLATPTDATCDGDPRWRPVLTDLKRFLNQESLED